MSKMLNNFFRNKRENDQPEIKEFKSMVDSKAPASSIFDYYLKHFQKWQFDVLHPKRLEKTMFNFLKAFFPYFSTVFDDENIFDAGVNFLKIALKIDNIDMNLSEIISNFILELIKSNNLFEKRSELLKELLNINNVVTLIFSTKYIKNVFVCLFEAKTYCKEYTEILVDKINNEKLFKGNGYDVCIKYFIELFKEKKINNCYMAFYFIGFIYKSIKPIDFIDEFFKVVEEHIYDFDSCNFLNNYLKVSSKKIWVFLCNVCKSKKTKTKLLLSLLSIFADYVDSQYITQIPVETFIKRAKEIPQEEQDKLFLIIQQFPEDRQLYFFRLSVPNWITGVSSQFLFKLSLTNSNFDEMIKCFFFDVDFNEFSKHIKKDSILCEILSHLTIGTSKNNLNELTYKLILLSNQNIATVYESLKYILKNSDYNQFTQPIIDGLKDKIIDSKVFTILTELAYSNENFVRLLLKDGIPFLFFAFKEINDLNFLSSLVSNGPYEVIDDFISKYFDKTILKELNENQLKNLLYGLPLGSQSFGVIRIPSLVKYVKNIELALPYDMFVYGKYSIKYSEPRTNDYCIQYINEEKSDLKLLFNDAQLVKRMTDLNVSFQPIYQCHFDMPNAKAKYSSDSSFSFWFYIHHLKGKTTILQTSIGNITFDCDGITFFENQVVNCPIKKWIFITINRDRKEDIIQFFVNGLFEFELQTKMNSSMLFGSDKYNNGIWFLHSKIEEHSFLSSDEVQNIFMKGIPNKEKINNKENYLLIPDGGFKFVPYNGIGNYLDILGGEAFIFIKMIESDDKGSFSNYLESAFNLYSKQLISSDFFQSSLRYVFIKKSSFIDEKIIYNLIFNFFNLNDYISVFSDYQIISSMKIKFDFLLRLFKSNFDFYDLLQVLLDCCLLFELDKEIQMIFYQSIDLYVKKNPSFCEKIILTISSVNPNYIYDDSIDGLFEIVLNNSSNLFSNSCLEHLLRIASYLPKKHSLLFLKEIKKYSLKNNEFVSYKDLKSNKSFFLLLINEIEVWYCLLTFLTCEDGNCLNDFKSKSVKRTKILKLILDLLANFIQYELKHDYKIEELVSFKIVEIIYDISEEKELISFPNQIIRLSTLGFNELPYQKLPFDNHVENFEKPLQSHSYDFELINIFSQKLYPMTISYLKNLNLQIEEKDYNKNVVLPKINSEIFNLKAISIITEISARSLLFELSNNYRKNLFYNYLVFGYDVYPQVVLEMSPLIIIAFLNLNPQLTDEIIDSFFEFLILRVNEGWFQNYLCQILTYSIPLMKVKLKSIKFLILLILSKLEKISEIVQMLVKLFYNETFVLLLNDSNFQSSIQHIICNHKILQDENFSILQTIIIQQLNETPFTSAIENKHLVTWFATQIDAYDESIASINKFCSSSLQELHLLRNKITRYRKTQSFEFHNDQRNIDLNLFQKSFEFQFFYKLNKTNLNVEKAISQIFKQKYHLDLLSNTVSKFMVSSPSNPLTVPCKLVPLFYSFEMSTSKKAQQIIPKSVHIFPFKTKVKELLESKNAPVSYKDWYLPPFVCIGITELLQNIIGTEPQNCGILSTPEIMECVFFQTNDTFYYLMGSCLRDNTIILKEDSEMFCHYVAFELPSYGYYGNSTLFYNHHLVFFNYTDVMLAIPRRYAHKNTSVDVYLSNGFSHTIIFESKKVRKIFLSKIKPNLNGIINRFPSFGIGLSQKLFLLPFENVTKLWIKQKLSTLNYLMYLNMCGGRSFRDLTQYPVVPWILGNLNNDAPVVSRDLSKTMGNQTPYRALKFIDTYKETKYHFGTHYSHPAAVLHYLLRTEPYYLFSIHLHNGMDHRDRLFYDISESWKSASEVNQADVKELIPEFYCFPNMFENTNSNSIPTRSNGDDISNVRMPNWGKNPIQLIYEMRKALEESKSINLWINLIFGYQQRGQEAIDSINVFNPLSYQDSFKNKKIIINDKNADIEVVNNFGQCPLQLFTNIHPPKKEKTLEYFGNCKLYISKLKKLEQIPTSIKVMSNDIIYEYSKSVKCYSTDYIYSAEFIDKCGISVDLISGNHILTISTLFYKISKISFSSQHFLICAADDKNLFLFDVSSGYLIRKKTLKENIQLIQFDEVNNFIIVTTRKTLYLLGIDFREIITENTSQEITSIATFSSQIWRNKPFIFVGTNDGKLNLWLINIKELKFEKELILEEEKVPISLIYTFDYDQAAIAIYSNGTSFLLSIPKIKHKILNQNYYDECPNCHSSENNTYFVCSICGICYCKNCREKLISNECSRCLSLIS